MITFIVGLIFFLFGFNIWLIMLVLISFMFTHNAFHIIGGLIGLILHNIVFIKNKEKK